MNLWIVLQFLIFFTICKFSGNRGNHGRNIYVLSHVSAQFPFSPTELEIDFYNQKVTVQVDSIDLRLIALGN